MTDLTTLTPEELTELQSVVNTRLEEHNKAEQLLKAEKEKAEKEKADIVNKMKNDYFYQSYGLLFIYNEDEWEYNICFNNIVINLTLGNNGLSTARSNLEYKKQITILEDVTSKLRFKNSPYILVNKINDNVLRVALLLILDSINKDSDTPIGDHRREANESFIPLSLNCLYYLKKDTFSIINENLRMLYIKVFGEDLFSIESNPVCITNVKDYPTDKWGDEEGCGFSLTCKNTTYEVFLGSWNNEININQIT